MRSLKVFFHRILPKNAFARGVSVLVGGTVGAQALMLLASPLLTRLYTPEDFGLLAVYASILSLFTVIASLRYELAIPLPEKDSEAAHVVILSLFMVGVIAAVSALIILIAGDFLAQIIDASDMANYLWLIPIGVLTIGFYQVFYFWGIRTKNFGGIAKTNIWQSLVALGVQLSSFKLGVLALMLGQTFGQGAGVITLVKSSVKVSNFKVWGWGDLKNVAIRYKKFPIFSTWGGFLNAASTQLPPLLFAIFFSAGVAGLYALSHRVLAMPMSLIGSAVGNVFFSNAAEAYREDRLAPLFELVYIKLVTIIMPVMLVLIIDAPTFFAFVFGESWREAGEMARWMVPWLTVVFIASPLSVLFDVLEKQREGVCFQVLMLMLRVVGILIGYKYNSVFLAVILFSSLSMLCWLGFLLWVASVSKVKKSRLLASTLKSIVLTNIAVSPMLLASIFNSEFLYWCFSVFISVVFILAYYHFMLVKNKVN